MELNGPVESSQSYRPVEIDGGLQQVALEDMVPDNVSRNVSSTEWCINDLVTYDDTSMLVGSWRVRHFTE